MKQNHRARAVSPVPRCHAERPVSTLVSGRDASIEDLLNAIADIDRDDIHQAAERLARVQDWIKHEAERAAADPVFGVLRLAS